MKSADINEKKRHLKKSERFIKPAKVTKFREKSAKTTNEWQ
jgi:hypothetical protein